MADDFHKTYYGAGYSNLNLKHSINIVEYHLKAQRDALYELHEIVETASRKYERRERERQEIMHELKVKKLESKYSQQQGPVSPSKNFSAKNTQTDGKFTNQEFKHPKSLYEYQCANYKPRRRLEPPLKSEIQAEVAKLRSNPHHDHPRQPPPQQPVTSRKTHLLQRTLVAWMLSSPTPNETTNSSLTTDPVEPTDPTPSAPSRPVLSAILGRPTADAGDPTNPNTPAQKPQTGTGRDPADGKAQAVPKDRCEGTNASCGDDGSTGQDQAGGQAKMGGPKSREDPRAKGAGGRGGDVGRVGGAEGQDGGAKRVQGRGVSGAEGGGQRRKGVLVAEGEGREGVSKNGGDGRVADLGKGPLVVADIAGRRNDNVTASGKDTENIPAAQKAVALSDIQSKYTAQVSDFSGLILLSEREVASLNDIRAAGKARFQKELKPENDAKRGVDRSSKMTKVASGIKVLGQDVVRSQPTSEKNKSPNSSKITEKISDAVKKGDGRVSRPTKILQHKDTLDLSFDASLDGKM